MANSFQIEGLYTLDKDLDNRTGLCRGIINFSNRRPQLIYAVWELRDSSAGPLAGVGRWYYLGKENYTDQEALEKILDHIHGYRMSRKRVFSNVKVIAP